MKRLITISIFLLCFTLTAIIPHTYAWQYGVSMSPYYSEYDSVEMPTAGMHWSAPTLNAWISFWVSSTTTDGFFVQNGYIYNGYSFSLRIVDDLHTIPPNSWAMFWTYYDPVERRCHGDVVPPLSDWSAGDHIYFSIAVYPSQKTISFMFTDLSRCQVSGDALVCLAIVVKVLGVSFSGRLSGNVGGIAESDIIVANFGSIYVDQAALWAQDIARGGRNCGNAYVYDTGDSPSNVLVYVYGADIFQLGFNQGYHYSAGTQLWSANLVLGTELVPPSDP